MADIKKFTGYIATDGSTHETLAKAQKYADELKIKEALKTAFPEGCLKDDKNAHDVDGGRYLALDDSSIPDWLFANRDAITAAFNQKARTRAPRKPKAAKVTAGAVGTPQASIALQ